MQLEMHNHAKKAHDFSQREHKPEDFKEELCAKRFCLVCPRLKSQLVGEENSMNVSRERFGHTRLLVDLDYFPPFPFAFNKRALLGDGLVTVHIEVDLFSSWIAVVPEHYLLGGFHDPHPCQLDADSSSCGAFEPRFLTYKQRVRLRTVMFRCRA